LSNSVGFELPNYAITKLQITQSGRIHGKHKDTDQGRTQESKANSPQESEGGETAEATGVRTWLEKAQSEEDGTRRGETLRSAIGI
jgi:hypothetical protein